MKRSGGDEQHMVRPYRSVPRLHGRPLDHGQQIAERWCVSCHLVAASQLQTTTAAPPFATIAGKPDFDVDRLTSFLLEPYPRMPNMSLTRAEAADLAAIQEIVNGLEQAWNAADAARWTSAFRMWR